MSLYKLDSPERRKRLEEMLNDPDAGTLKKEIEIMEGLKAKLEAEMKNAKGKELEGLSKQIAEADAVLAKLRKSQAQMDKRAAKAGRIKGSGVFNPDDDIRSREQWGVV